MAGLLAAGFFFGDFLGEAVAAGTGAATTGAAAAFLGAFFLMALDFLDATFLLPAFLCACLETFPRAIIIIIKEVSDDA